MRNCPKCGNQLQEGVNVCTICGTNILEKTEEAKTPTAAPAQAEPVQQQEVLDEKKEETAAPAATPTQAETTTPPPATTEQTPAVAPTTESLAPTVEQVASTPVPSIPTSLTNKSVDPITEDTTKAKEEGPKLTKKPKKGVNKGVVFVFLIIVLLAIGGYVFMNMNSSMKDNGTTPAATPKNVAGTKVSSNGFKFNLANGWMINEDGNIVVIVNESSTVAIKLAYSKSNLAEVSKDRISDILEENELYKDTVVNEIKLTGRDTYQVNTIVNEIPVQVYFINGGSDLTLGATVVYQTAESKTKYEPEVTEMLGSLSYSNDSIKALDIMSSYSEMFGVYDKIVSEIEESSSSIPDVPKTPEEPEQPEEPEKPEEPEEPEEPEKPAEPTNPGEKPAET